MDRHNQKGVGLVEVLVALVILALGVLGFAALQLRALDAAQEATEQTVAMSTARDLAERMRINRGALGHYKTAINSKSTVNNCMGTTKITSPKALALPKCNEENFAKQDAGEVLAKATNNGQMVVIHDCVASELNCIYVAWGKTVISANDLSECIDTTTGAYIVNSKCLVMEAF
ncbi:MULTISPECIES: type IV pilus modification protein PilV [unclassified Acinetobacter]|uniref:type IV pilus modification protein PilV n=1 Tax=unclassified Acinetobacter TaxID=196816 RepID=UPI00157B2054|nr:MULTISPECIES: type IV pilus modification protein PilV [unclassified Acinetobacter]MDM1756736.1 type IV pilus modification protein PilV [Acinetobacter sp. 256-1]MDM1761954.1 type IV pilus modification protein PilV [Acinetobacter sp. 251-1]